MRVPMPMIRNVVLGRLRAGGDRDEDSRALDQALAALAALPFEGLVDVHVGRDLGLREGGWDFAITSDWLDADAYRVYDLDPEHNRLRREEFARVCDHIARVQIRMGG